MRRGGLGKKTDDGSPPLIGVVSDATTTYGRAIVRGVTRYANLQRRWLLFLDLDRSADILSELPPLDGGVFAGMDAPVIQEASRRFPHIVNCSGGGDPAICPIVALDDEVAGRMAAEHLLNCQFEHFAFYGYASHHTVAGHRLTGFKAALAERGFDCSVCPVGVPTAEQRINHTHHPQVIAWLRSLPKPAGIMATDDSHAYDLASICLEAKIAVPESIAIVGVNNDDLLCESAWPALSSVDADYSRMGYAAAALLDRMLRGEKIDPSEQVTRLRPLGVIERQSTNTLAISDRDICDALRYIRLHACDPCSVGDVLREVPVGRRWLERQFVTHLGRTPHDEITRVRVETAQRLLRRVELTMNQISARCGFAELKNFYVAFRKLTGTTPSAYRKKVLHGL